MYICAFRWLGGQDVANEPSGLGVRKLLKIIQWSLPHSIAGDSTGSGVWVLRPGECHPEPRKPGVDEKSSSTSVL